MINQVILLGNLGDDVKLHFFEDGGCVGKFPLATSRHWINKQTGEKVSETSWHNITVRNKTAEHCEKYLEKGSKVYVSGSIKYTKWQNAEGKDQYGTEISAVNVKFLDPPKEGSGQPTTERTTTGGKPQAKEQHAGDQFLAGQQAPPPKQEEADDLPF